MYEDSRNLPRSLRSLLAELPERAGTVLLVLLLALSVTACGGSSSDDDGDEDEAGEEDDNGDNGDSDGDGDGTGELDQFGISLGVAGLAEGAELVVTDGHSEITVDANQDYSFPEEVDDGSSYAIEVLESASGHQCWSENGSGTIDGEDIEAQLNCERDPVLRTLAGTGELKVEVTAEGATSPDAITLFWGYDCDWADGSDCTPGDSQTVSAEEPVTLDTGDQENVGLRAVADYGEFELESHTARRMGSVAFNDVARTALALHGDHYIGGDFDVTGYATGAITRLSLPDGQPMPFPEVLGEVSGTSRDEDGYTYIGGEFRKVDGIERDGLARITPDGELDPDWAPSVSGGAVRTLAVTEFGLAVGGDFDEINGSHSNFALLSPDTGEELGWDAGTEEEVLAVAEFSGHVVLGGDFEAGGSSRLRALDGDGERVDLPEPDEPVRALMTHQEQLLVGGFFLEIGVASRSLVAGLDESFEVSEFQVDLDASPDGQELPNVTAIDTEDEDIILGGNFGGVGDGEQENLAWVNEDGEARDWAPRPDGRVQAVALVEGHVLVGGSFDDIAWISDYADAEGPIDRDRYAIPHLAVLKLAEHEDDEYPDALRGFTLGADAQPFSVTRDGETLVVAGELSMVGLHMDGASGIARFDGDLALDTGASHLMADGGVHDFGSVERDGSEHLLAVGDFNRFVASPAEELDRFAVELRSDGSQERAWSPSAEGGDEIFTAVTADAEHRYLSGDFSSILNAPGGPGLNTARTDDTGEIGDPGDRWATENDDGPRDRVLTAVLHQDSYYMAGRFEAVGGADDSEQEDRAHLAAFAVDDGELRDWNPGSDSTTAALATNEDQLFVGRDDGGWQVSSMAGSGGDPDTGAALNANDEITGLVVEDERLFILGEFSEIDGQPRPGFAIAGIDDDDLSLQDIEIESPADRAGNPVAPSSAFATADDGFCLLGDFRAIGDQVRGGIACFDADGELQR